MPTSSNSPSGANPPIASVVVPMKDAAQTISETLAGLAAQECPIEFEVLVVDNGSTDASADIVRSFRSEFPRLEVIQAPDRPGAAYARNVGASQANGEILAFCDADDVPQKDWLWSLIQASDGTGAVGGQLVAIQGDAPTRVGVQSQRLPGLMGYLPWSTSANFAVPRGAFVTLNGFDEDLRVCEDVDFCWRLQQAGYTLKFCPDAVVEYRSRPSDFENARRCFAYAQGDVLIYRKHSKHGAMRRSLAGVTWAWLKLTVSTPRVLAKTSRPKYLNSLARNLGWLVGSVKYRTFYP